MKIKWLGHASFLITSEKGTRIITDPYTVGGGISYGSIDETADIVTVSHEHGDHNNASVIKGKPEVLKSTGKKVAKGIEFTGIASYHDDTSGKQRGANVIYCFTVDGIRICHLGDLGHKLSDKQLADIGAVDVLLIPVGGLYTIDAVAAVAVCGQLKPKVAIPMHFKTGGCGYPISGVEEFTRGKTGVKNITSSEAEFKKDKLPAAAEIVVFKPALC